MEDSMKKIFRFGLVLVISIFCLIPTTDAQQPSPQDLNGTWEVHMIGEGTDWGEDPEHGAGSVTLTFTVIGGVVDPTVPNLIIDVPDSDDDFFGFARNDMFAVHKENIDNCGGPSLNFGREMIIGTMNKNGKRFKAKGMGFDSDPECGGTWSYTLIAKKISD